MKLLHIARCVAWSLLTLVGISNTGAQNFPFTSGAIPPCQTSNFTATVTGVGWLQSSWWGWGAFIESLTINITSDHPQTLSISLTSPEGTTLLLSAFNGAGGQNYTNTTFISGGNNITLASAPFTGFYSPQGGNFDVFDNENADGVWTISVQDTACANGGTGPGGTWTPGWFDGSGSGGFSFGFSSPPPCLGWIPSGSETVCTGGTFDILSYYTNINDWYEYSFGSWSGIPFNPTAAPPGSYYVDAYDPWEGCWYSASFDVIELPQVDLGPDLVLAQCDNEGPVDLTTLFTIAPGTDAYWFNGTPISNGAATSVSEEGTYQVVGGAGTACGDTALVFLSIPTSPDLGPDQALSICPGSALDLSGLFGTTDATTDWSFGGAPFLSPGSASQAGTYTIVATAPNGCSDMAQVDLSLASSPQLGPDQTITGCSNQTVDLAALFTIPGASMEWSVQGVVVSDPSSVSLAGNFQVVASSGAGCTDTAFVTYSPYAAPDLGPDVTTSTCEGDPTDLSLHLPDLGTTTWSLNGTVVPDPTMVSEAGTYQAIVTDASGCQDTALVELLMEPLPMLGADQAITICAGGIVDLTALMNSNTATAEWTLSGLPVPEPGAVAEAGIYELVAISAAGCSSTGSITITVSIPPDLGPDQIGSICTGDAFDATDLFNTAGLATTWTLDGDNVTDPSMLDVAGNYRLIVVDLNGCADTAFFTLDLMAPPSLGPDQAYTLCAWQTIDLTALVVPDGNEVAYTLAGMDVTDPDAVHEAGSYMITASNALGCSDEVSVVIENVECACEADFIHDAECVQEPVQFTLLADSAVVGAMWSFNAAAAPSSALDPLVAFTEAGTVTVTLEVTLSCGVVVVEQEIELADCALNCSVWLPNSFTPNGDALNDVWSWKGDCEPEDFHMDIFDRFGTLIFASVDPDKAWDGTIAGSPVPPGVYSYHAGYRLPYQKEKDVRGSITLLR